MRISKIAPSGFADTHAFGPLPCAAFCARCARSRADGRLASENSGAVAETPSGRRIAFAEAWGSCLCTMYPYPCHAS